MHEINNLPGYISLGNLLDFGHALVVDVSAWADRLPDRDELSCIRSGETMAYPVVGRVFDSAAQTLMWTVSAVDTGISGSGSLVIEAYRADEQLVHTPMVQTIVGAGHGDVGDAPEPLANWISDATAKLNEMDGRDLNGVEFVGDDMVFSKVNADTVTLAGAKTTLKGDQGIQGIQGVQGLKGNKGDVGNVLYATFSQDSGDIIMTTPDGYTGPTFAINNNNLEVTI